MEKRREIEGLVDALQIYRQAQGLILTADETGEEQVMVGNQRHSIHIMPIWQSLLRGF